MKRKISLDTFMMMQATLAAPYTRRDSNAAKEAKASAEEILRENFTEVDLGEGDYKATLDSEPKVTCKEFKFVGKAAEVLKENENYPNEYIDCYHDDWSNPFKEITEFGVRVVKRCNKCGIIRQISP